MKLWTQRALFAIWFLATTGSALRAQVVNDGASATLVNVTNTITGDVTVGTNGSFTLLVLSNNLLLTNSAHGVIGHNATARSNEVRLTGASTRWLMGGELRVGFFGSGNRLVVSNGGVARNIYGVVGLASSSSNNQAVVTGPGSVWSNVFELYVGNDGAGNRLVVSNGGTVVAQAVYLGFNPTSTNNLILVDGGTLRATNATGTGFFEVRGGTNIFNAGTITANWLLATNPAGSFDFKGGILSVGNSTIGNGRPFIAGGSIAYPTFFNLLGNGLHTFDDGLIISNAALQGSGTIVGPVTVSSVGRIDLQSTNATDKLFFSNTPSLGGVVFLDLIKKSPGVRTNDQIQVAGNLVYGGSMFVARLGAEALTVGDRFQLFRAGSFSGAFSGIYPPALTPDLKWSNHLLVDGSIEVVTSSPPAIAAVRQIGTNLVLSITNGNLSYGFDLLASTNVALPSSNWTAVTSGFFDWLGNATITNGINPAFPTRFFRLFQYVD